MKNKTLRHCRTRRSRRQQTRRGGKQSSMFLKQMGKFTFGALAKKGVIDNVSSAGDKGAKLAKQYIVNHMKNKTTKVGHSNAQYFKPIIEKMKFDEIGRTNKIPNFSKIHVKQSKTPEELPETPVSVTTSDGVTQPGKANDYLQDIRMPEMTSRRPQVKVDDFKGHTAVELREMYDIIENLLHKNKAPSRRTPTPSRSSRNRSSSSSMPGRINP